MSYNFGRDEIFWRIGHEESPELLAIIGGLDSVDFRDDNGTTYLHIAAINHKLQIIKLLLEKGADPNWQDKNGKSPILYAIGRNNKNNPEILRLFLVHGLDLDRNEKGMSLRERIISFGNPELNRVIEQFEKQ